MYILKLLIYLYLLLRPYYFFNSGMIQISDIIFLTGSIVFLLLMSKNKKLFKKIIIDNRHYLFFLFFVMFINLIYFIIYQNFGFILSTLYYIFNYIVIIVFSIFINDDNFINMMSKIIRFNIIVQLLLCVTGIGNNWLGTYRYMGTFNDPNQFAYYILISYCILLLINKKNNIKINIFMYFIFCTYLILKSSSTGMILGMTCVSFLDFIHTFKKIILFIRNNIKRILLFIYIMLVVLTFVIIKPKCVDIIKNVIFDSKITNRISEKINKVDSSNENDLWHERGYNIIFQNPKYILYGAGQGDYNRFNKSSTNSGEIHATLPSILFYYGIIPTLLIIYWVYNKLKKLPFEVLIVYIALFIESFTLQNSRQALFWIIILLGSSFKLDKKEKNDI